MAKTISFSRGAPSADIVPAKALREAAGRALEADPVGAFSYGKATGYEPLREWIAEKHQVEVERVLVTNGSLQADSFLFDLLVEPDDAVVVESPTYDRTLNYLQQCGADVLAIPLEEDGIDVGAVATVMESGTRVKLTHIIPNFQNPAGSTLSLDKRKRLVALAAEHDSLIFEDDPYIELNFKGERIPTMLSLDSSDGVVYASSFSKTICPGIRVGYAVGPPELVARLAKLATDTYISPNMVSQAIVAEFCRSGAIEENIEAARKALSGRRDAMVSALKSEIPDARFSRPEGGYFLWVELPEGTEVAELEGAAASEGVTFVKGTDFMIQGGESAMRLAYSGVSEDEITEGIKRLARSLNRMKTVA